MKFSQRNG